MVRTSLRVAAALALLAIAAVAPLTPCSAHVLQPEAADASYVVQIHASRDPETLGFVPNPAATRSQVMTLASGQRFECFIPLTPEALRAQQQEQQQYQQEDAVHESEHDEDAQQEAAFLAFGRAAAKKIRPKCIQFVDMAESWVYEVCPGVLVRKVSLRARGAPDSDPVTSDVSVSALGSADSDTSASVPASAPTSSGLAKKRKMKLAAAATTATTARSHEVVELGQFESDRRAAALAFSDFVGADTQERVRTAEKPLFTQVYRSAAAGDDAELLVQFLCSASAADDTVAGVQWRRDSVSAESSSSSGSRELRAAAGFLVLSRAFCDPEHGDADEYARFTVPSLLQPLVDAHTCVKRNEGWWTYEFCFGRGVRQYHRDAEGRVTAEFSLGTYDAEQNSELATTGGALVLEHIDATHDAARPAFVELYDHGSHCKEFDHLTPRRAKVYYYCSQGGASHHILSVKEAQTCAYAIKVSSPVLCDHPHFVSGEQRGDARAEVVHCVPLSDDDSDSAAAVVSDAPLGRAPRVQLQDAVDAAAAATTAKSKAEAAA